MRNSTGIALVIGLAASTLAGAADAADKIKVGFSLPLRGRTPRLARTVMRGFDLAVMQHHNKAGGKDLEIIRGSSDASSEFRGTRSQETG